MINKIKKIISTIIAKLDHSNNALNIKFLRWGISTSLLFEIILIFPIRAQLAFNSSLNSIDDTNMPFLYRIFYLAESERELTFLFIISTAIIALNIFKKNIFIHFLVWVISISFHYKFRAITDAGSSIIDIFSLFLIFTTEEKQKKVEFDRVNIKYFISNLAVKFIQIQLCIVYIMAGIGKVISPLWLHGNALYTILKFPEYSLPYIHQNITNNWLLMFANYFTILFQITWPIGVYFKKSRKIYLFLGTIMHISISYVMGITTFGFTMLVSYFIFSDLEKTNQIINSGLEYFKKLFKSIKINISNSIYKNYGRILTLLLVFAIFHHISVLDLILPRPIGGNLNFVHKRYTLPYFPQVYLLFGPQLKEYSNKLNIKCQIDNTEKEWIDPIQPIIEEHHKNRFSIYGYLARSISGWSIELGKISIYAENSCQSKNVTECLQKIIEFAKKDPTYLNILKGSAEICESYFGKKQLAIQIRHIREYINGKKDSRTFAKEKLELRDN